MKKITATLLVLFMVVMNGPASVYAAWAEQQNIGNPNGSGNIFGGRVDISGDYAIAGAPWDSYNGQPANSGAAWIYKRSGTTWSFTTGTHDCDDTVSNECLKEPTPTESKMFGTAVSIDGNYAAVSAVRVTGTSSIYIFKNNGSDVWSVVETINDPSARGDGWGRKIDLDGDYLAIRDTSYNSNQGQVEIYKRITDDNWTLQANMRASDGSADDYYGDPKLDGDYLIVGCSIKNSYTGGAYIYDKSLGSTGDWDGEAAEEVEILDGESADDEFGGSTWIDGNYAAIGAYGFDSGDYQGKVYIYYNNAGTWALQDEITASDGQSNDEFGISVALSGDKLAVGADGYPGGLYQGAVYFYARSGTTWGSEEKKTISGAADDDSLGTSIAMDGSYTIASAPYMNTDTGEAFVYYFTSGGGAVPEFSDYLLMLTVIIAIGFMVKTVPNITGAPAARA